MKKHLLIAAVAFASVAPSQVFAWGKTGHEIVAEIAMKLLDNSTRKKVEHYLGGYSPEAASVWMDDVRKDHSFDYMKPWHYINAEKGATYTPTKEDNAVNILNKTIAQLRDHSQSDDQEIQRQLLILFHLTGDLHMPLHAGYGSDKGGNSVQVTYLDHKGNLHWVWDNEIIETEHIDLAQCMELYKSWTRDEIKQYSQVNVEQWMQQSRDLLPVVYDFKDNTIDKAYADKNAPIIRKQLTIAGLRLAEVLKETFGP